VARSCLIITFALLGCATQRAGQVAYAPGVSGISQQTGATILRERLVADRVWPHISPDCLYLEPEEETSKFLRFAARYDQGKCGGDSFSTLLDRFVVNREDGSLLWYNVPEDRDYPYEQFLAFMHCVHACPTSDSGAASQSCYDSCTPEPNRRPTSR